MGDVAQLHASELEALPTLVTEVRRRARETPDRTALTFLVDGELGNARPITYAELDREARAFAGAYQESGGPGDRVLILAQPGLEFVSSFLGCLYAGQVAVAMSLPGLSKLSRFAPRLKTIIDDARPATIVVPRQVLSRADALTAAVPGLRDCRWLGVEEVQASWAERWHATPPDPSALAFLQYTSGSTGAPKGVMVSHRNVAANCRHIRRSMWLDEGSVMVSWLPPYHDMGLIGCILSPLYNGFPCTMMSPMAFIGQPARWLKVISHVRATISGGPNFAYEYCVRRTAPSDRSGLDLGSWKVAFNGAETVRSGTLARFSEAFAPHGFAPSAHFPCYGLAEATLLVTGVGAREPVVRSFSHSALARHRAKPAPDSTAGAGGGGADGDRLEMVGCGSPADGTAVEIVDPASGRLCAAGEVGEIWISGPGVAEGYYGKPEATAETFGARTSDGRGPFLRTGDLGFQKEEQLFVSGRIKDLLIFRGQNFYAHDLVATAANAHPGLMASGGAAFTVDAEGEERLVLVHELAREAGEADPAGLLSAIREVIAATFDLALHAAVLIPTGALPRTTSGKVRHQECRRLYLAGELKIRAEWREPVTARLALEPWRDAEGLRARLAGPERAEVLRGYVVATIGRVLGDARCASLAPETPLAALAIDSVRMATLASAWERDLGVTLDLAGIFASATVGGLIDALSERQRNGGGKAAAVPRIQPRPEEAHLPFPLTDIQRAYWVGRSGALELGEVSCYAYLEVDCPRLELPRLGEAWRKVIDRHGMLRAVVAPDGTQRVLESVAPYEIREYDLRGMAPESAEERLSAVREEMSQQVLPADRWPLFDFRSSRLPDGRVRLHLGIDLLVADVLSLRILFAELTRFYEDEDATLPSLTLSFRDCVLADLAATSSARYEEDRRYWQARMATLPGAPSLPLACSPAAVQDPRFRRRAARLSPKRWARLRERAAAEGLTPSGVLLAAYAEVLAAWSASQRFLVGLTVFNRPLGHEQVMEVVGDFTSISILEVDGSAPGTFADRAVRLRDQLRADLAHRSFSGVRVLRELASVRCDESPVFAPVVFTSDVGLGDAGAGHPLEAFGDVTFGVSQTPQVWLDHQVHELAGALLLHWDAVEPLFPPGLLDDMFEGYVGLLQRLADDEGTWRGSALREVLLPAAQRERRRITNATEGPAPEERLQTLFAAQAAARSGEPAVCCGDRTLSYGELHARASALAARLTALGARPGQLVAVVMEKGWEQVVGVLGVLHSGAAYLPLDAALPAERLAELLADGEVTLAVTQAQRVAGLQWPAGVRPVVVDPEPPEGGTLAPPRSAGGKAAEGELAYVIYTSGSTGKPKGVMIEQRSVVNTIADVNERFEVGPRDRVLALSSLSFDLSVYDVFGLLAAGGCVVLPGPDQLGDPAQWLQLVERHGVTVWNTVPAFMNMFVEYLAGSGRPWPSSLRLVLMSGDWIPLDLPGRIASLAPRCRVVSLGGATEASIWSIGYPVERIDAGWKSVPYGTPLRNQRFHVLDDRLEDAPDWVPGQLYIGGAGLAAGYWKDPEKTRQSFVTHPVTGDRLYRTGDLGRYLPDGNIEFLGRRDLQVKVGGHRIELGEIESVLGQHPAVKEAAVLAVAAKEGAAPSRERRLAVFAVTRDGETGAEALAAHLRRRLPAYMVPGVIRVLPALPLTGNGKVDRKALAATLAETPAPRASAPQQAEGLRNRLFDLLASALGRGTLDPRASLLELGANSLDVVRIANRFERELGFRPGLQELIRFSTAEQLVAYYEEQIVRDATFGGAGGERAPRAASPAPGSTYDLVLDAKERAAFRSAQHGIRRDGLRPSLPLPHVDTDDDAVARALARRTVRQFLGGPLSAEALGGLLGALRQAQEGEKPRYRYGSAGGLYPVQAYLHLKPGAVAGLEGGTYYYHPRHHRLEQLRAGAEIDRRVFTLSNQEIFDGCSFSIFLVGQLDAIGPLYGGLSRDLCLIEAGLISQLLETVAPARGIGLCQIGTCDFERIRPLFDLGDSHHYLHCLLGGPTDPPGAWSGFQGWAAPSGSREAEVDTGTI